MHSWNKQQRERQYASHNKFGKVGANPDFTLSPYRRSNVWPKHSNKLQTSKSKLDLHVKGEKKRSLSFFGQENENKRKPHKKDPSSKFQQRYRPKSGQSRHSRQNSANVIISPEKKPLGDNVYFIVDSQFPGVPIIYRRKDHAINPERLNLDRKNLTQCPILRNEQRLRLLNYENNSIAKISNLNGLPNLIFLDLYNNELTRIESLEYVSTLRVLMLGRNNIQEIEGLEHLNRLDVLDLHGNRIRKITNINHLGQLRVLNLADNEIEVIENLDGMHSLVEFNCRRNRIHDISGLSNVSSLERVFLSDNCINNLTILASIFSLNNMKELSLDGNPVCVNTQHYRASIITSFPKLTHFDLKEITFEERGHCDSLNLEQIIQPLQEIKEISYASPTRISPLNLTKKKLQKFEQLLKNSEVVDPKNVDSLIFENEKIQAIKERWDQQNSILQSSLTIQKHQPLSDIKTSKYIMSPPARTSFHKYYEDEKKLCISGSWDFSNPHLGTLIEIQFTHVDYNSISGHFSLLKNYCPYLKCIRFSHNSIHCLYQIDALAFLPQLENISFGNSPEENPIIECSVYRSYCIFRFPHIKFVRDTEVLESERTLAKSMFSHLKNQWKNPNILRTRGWCIPDMERKPNSDRKIISNIYLHIKKNDEKKKDFAKNIVSKALCFTKQCRILRKAWPSTIKKFIDETLIEIESFEK